MWCGFDFGLGELGGLFVVLRIRVCATHTGCAFHPFLVTALFLEGSPPPPVVPLVQLLFGCFCCDQEPAGLVTCGLRSIPSARHREH